MQVFTLGEIERIDAEELEQALILFDENEGKTPDFDLQYIKGRLMVTTTIEVFARFFQDIQAGAQAV